MSTAPVTTSPIAVLGAGSWGTALAIQFARAGRTTRLWSRDRQQSVAMAQTRRNDRYLPEAAFPAGLTVAADLPVALDGAADVLIAVPSHGLRALLREIAPLLRAETRLAWATKGFELDTGLLPHQVAAEVLGTARPQAVLSGPTFAREVGAGLPTAMTVASADAGYAATLAQSLSSEKFRAYTSTDIVGVEVGGAVKNVLAVGAGLTDGLGFGANTRVALITRGLLEMTRLGENSVHAAKPSWGSPVSAIWCSPAPTINRAIVASDCCSRQGAACRKRSRTSVRWSKVISRPRPCIAWRAGSASKCRSAKASIAPCTKVRRRVKSCVI